MISKPDFSEINATLEKHMVRKLDIGKGEVKLKDVDAPTDNIELKPKISANNLLEIFRLPFSDSSRSSRN